MLGAQRRMERDWEVRRWMAWHIAALPLSKKFPEYEKFVQPEKPQKSPDELLLVARMLAQKIREAG